jgi:hypothetical protein
MRQLNYLRSSSGKALLFAFAAVYLLFAVGVFKSTHYCMGRASSVTVFSSESEKCFCEKYSKEQDGCCDDEHELIQIQDDHQPAVSYHLTVPHIYILGDLYTERLVAGFIDEAANEEVWGNDASPPVPIFKRNCSLVFYES